MAKTLPQRLRFPRVPKRRAALSHRAHVALHLERDEEQTYRERAVNGAFLAGTAGWLQESGSDITLSENAGRLRVARTTGDVTATPYLTLDLEPGAEYLLTLDVFLASTSVRVGTTVGAGDVLGNNESVGAVSRTFTAPSDARVYLSVWPVSTSSTVEIDNVSVRRVR